MTHRRGLGLTFCGVFVGYLIGGRFAFSLLSVTDLGAVFFAPAGLTVAALVLSPVRRWWVVLLAAGSAELLLDVRLGDYSAAGLAGFIAANLTEPLVGAGILRRLLGRPPDLSRTRDLASFVMVAGVAGPAAGALIGAIAAVHENGELDLWPVYLHWWLGDALGVILVGSAIVAIAAASHDRRSLASLEGAALAVGAPAGAIAVYWTTDLDVGVILLLAALTAGVRFGTKTVSVVSLVVATIALSSLPSTGELISGLDNSRALVLIKLQFAAFAIAGLTVAAEAAARDRTAEQMALERRVVSDLRRALLPGSDITGRSFRAVGCYQAASARIEVGGDWYDVSETADGIVSIAVGDIVGHGADAIASMGQLRFAMAGLTAAGLTPGESLTHLDQRAREVPGAMASTAWVATFDPSTGDLTYSTAGHPPPLLRDASGDWQWLEQGRASLLGVEASPRPEHTVTIGPSRLVIYTDGAIERRSEPIDVGLRRLREALTNDSDAAPAQLLDAVTQHDRFDDAVLVYVDLETRDRAAPSTMPRT